MYIFLPGPVELAILFVLVCPVACVHIDAKTKAYISYHVKAYESDPQSTQYGSIIIPSLDPTITIPDPEDFCLPKIILWCPVARHGLQLLCPEHHCLVRQSFWQDGPQIWRQPRLIYDIGGNILLISRNYICTSRRRCRFLSTDQRMMQQLPSRVIVPFCIQHRSGYTPTLMDYVYSQITHGMTFSEISRSLFEMKCIICEQYA